MGDGALSPNISDSNIDFNLISELLFDGFWLEATDASSNNITTNINSTSDLNIVSVNQNHQDFYQDFDQDFSKSSFVAHQAMISFPKTDEGGASESARLWVGPSRDAGHDKSVKKRLLQAINFLKETIRDKDVLVQIWIPVKKQGKQVLRASNQLFSLNPSCKSLASYRDVSQTYQFVADEDSTEFVGLLGRVFLNRLPEWTPDVRFFRREEYPRVAHAHQCNVRGSLALPVLEQGSGICLGVVEVVTTRQRVDFHPELQNVCKALEVVSESSYV